MGHSSFRITRDSEVDGTQCRFGEDVDQRHSKRRSVIAAAPMARGGGGRADGRPRHAIADMALLVDDAVFTITRDVLNNFLAR
jgi:hypothetical protein